MQHKASQGEYTGGWAPYGRRVAADGARLEPDPNEKSGEAEANEPFAAKWPSAVSRSYLGDSKPSLFGNERRN